jgi:hypothetical protein
MILVQLSMRHFVTNLLAAELQSFGYVQIVLVIARAQVCEQSAALTDHFEQSTAAGLILLVALQMLGELSNAVGQDGDLHFRRTGILVVAVKILDCLGLNFFCKRHDVCFLSYEISQVSVPTALTVGQDQSRTEIIPEKNRVTNRS